MTSASSVGDVALSTLRELTGVKTTDGNSLKGLAAIHADAGESGLCRRAPADGGDERTMGIFSAQGALFRSGRALIAAVVSILASGAAIGGETRPNVVLILADNVGYGDLGPYGGGELRGSPTPRIDELAREGLRLTQYLVEPACTPSRAALMTGQYSIRNGLSLIIVPGTATRSPRAPSRWATCSTRAGYATAIFGKWHLGREPQSLPTAHGFDEFYGIPPDSSWDSATYVDTITLTHSIPTRRRDALRGKRTA